MFESLVWQKDRLLYNGLVFRLEHYRSGDWDLGDECFVFYKIKKLVDQYEHFFASREFTCRHFLELGMWEGGSLPFWFEAFRPEKMVGIDLMERGDSAHFQRYVRERGLEQRIKTFWGVNQTDSQRLLNIAEAEFGSTIDLVLDDASHVYGPTLSSFETLFPLVRPGGLYIIEDWAWEHWPECHTPESSLARQEGLTRLIFEIMQAAGTSEALIKSVTVHEGFAAVERGNAPPADFKLDHSIVTRPRGEAQISMAGRLKAAIRAFRS